MDNRERVLRVPLSRIRPCPFQPRKDFAPEALKELADSIREQGIVQPLIDAWAADEGPIPTYPSGSQGPAAADELIERSGRSWRPVDLPPELR